MSQMLSCDWLHSRFILAKSIAVSTLLTSKSKTNEIGTSPKQSGGKVIVPFLSRIPCKVSTQSPIAAISVSQIEVSEVSYSASATEADDDEVESFSLLFIVNI